MKEDTKPKTTQNCPLTILTPQKEASDDWLTFKGGGWLQHLQVTLTPSTLNAELVLDCCYKLTQAKHMYYFTLLGSEVQRRSYWAKVKVSNRTVFLLEAPGDSLFAGLFQLLEAAHIPWLVAPSFISKARESGRGLCMLWSLWFSTLTFFLPRQERKFDFKNSFD